MAINPGSINNTFVRHTVFWTLFLPLISIIFLPVLFSNQDIDPKEQEMVQRLGVNIEKVTNRTNHIYTTAFINTGILPRTEDFFSGDIIGSKKYNIPIAAASSKFSSSWIRGVWTLIYKGLWRLNMLISIFFIPMLLLCIPAAIDGSAIRAKKRYDFGSNNPVFFYSSLHIAVLVFGLFIYLPLMPVTLTSGILGVFLAALAIAIWVASSNLQTGS
jgi:hypothetical protein